MTMSHFNALRHAGVSTSNTSKSDAPPVRRMSNTKSFKLDAHGSGGGGGSRTRVREYGALGLYMRVRP